MGIFDFFKRFRKSKDSGPSASAAITAVKAAAQASNYNQASIKAFQALEAIGITYAALERDVSTTAREYGALLVESGSVHTEDLMPIIDNFEIAKYSPEEVTFDDYRNIEQALETVFQKFKKPGKKVSKDGAKKQRRKRRKPKKRSATGRRQRRN